MGAGELRTPQPFKMNVLKPSEGYPLLFSVEGCDPDKAEDEVLERLGTAMKRGYRMAGGTWREFPGWLVRYRLFRWLYSMWMDTPAGGW